ncbi:MAG: uncharacterized protein PWQ82_1472 [Thermosediminibacterales bacterium]|nr:uncharacterized protein [Thermosediminibacterales bacterium]
MKLSRKLRYFYFKFRRNKDSPARIARGIALGVSLDFFPTFGLGLIIAFLVAGLFRANRRAAVLAAIACKWLIPFFYFLNVKMGQALLGKNLFDGPFIPTDGKIFPFHVINFENLSYTFLIGSIINGILSAILAYYISLKLTLHYKNLKAYS